jgi:hypothetical protein
MNTAGARTIVHNVIDLAILSGIRSEMGRTNSVWHGGTNFTVASTIVFGKSSAPTSPATYIASPPAALISSATAAAFLSSILDEITIKDEIRRSGMTWDLLAYNDFGAFLRKEQGSTASNTLIMRLLALSSTSTTNTRT